MNAEREMPLSIYVLKRYENNIQNICTANLALFLR